MYSNNDAYRRVQEQMVEQKFREQLAEMERKGRGENLKNIFNAPAPRWASILFLLILLLLLVGFIAAITLHLL
ncbi:MAG TPA: hypothetical protein VFA41_07620 [Ktedonobacteraceae bacterium]|jgi:hypothetical protein|nr:hypothetical protein [Ktedonobacteraceae bacterium]